MDLKFVDKKLTEDSLKQLELIKLDFCRLNIPDCLNCLYNKYSSTTNCNKCKEILKLCFELWLNQALEFFEQVMRVILIYVRADVISECKSKVVAKSKIFNLVEGNAMPKGKLALLKKGINFIPHNKPSKNDFCKDLKIIIKRCLVGSYKGITGKNVRVDKYNINTEKYSINELMQIIRLQPDFNDKVGKCILDITEKYHELSNVYINDLFCHNGNQISQRTSLKVNGGYISMADKGIAVCIMPHSWYQVQFTKLIQNPSYSLLNLRECDVINMLKNKAEDFKNSLNTKELEYFQEHFTHDVNDPRIANIKLLPKAHKLDCEPSLANLFDIPSRVVRGGEACVLNPYSICLQKMLTDTMIDLRNNFKIISKSDLAFPLITGCEQYNEYLRNINVKGKAFFSTLLITSDFKDAFTNANLAQLINGITKAGAWLKYNKDRITTMIKLAKLIIPLCTFLVPQGVVQSHDGYPIGGHSSCECLNLNLLVCEFQTIMSFTDTDDCLRSFCRLVDDVSYIFQGTFGSIINTLCKIVKGYPAMELNVQISPRPVSYTHLTLPTTPYV